MSQAERRCLCGEPTAMDYAPGHDARHATELALAVSRGAISEDAAAALLPTAKIVEKMRALVAARSDGTYKGNVTTWGAWLDEYLDDSPA